ncbi:MAG TPA: glycosyltransferase family 9 protein [Casimicrobiaceae bacterium]|nr:glycosyltransferase family 9 protein [Casimicrobiaceae bacterium]
MNSDAFIRQFHLLVDSGEIDQAALFVESAIAIDSSNVDARYARGVVAIFDRDFELAEREMRHAIAGRPTFALALHGLGAIAQWRKEYLASIEFFTRALQCDPASSDTSVAFAHSLLALGRYDEGWRHFEARPGGLAHLPRQKGAWDGSPIPNGALAVFGEQGLGDVVQFCRYVPSIANRAQRVYLLLDGPFATLAPLLASLAGVDAIVTDHRAGPSINAHCPIMTLAQIAGASTSTPGDVPYLSVPDERMRRWRARLGVPRSRRVGLVWHGNPRATVRGSDIDARRSISPELLTPLSEVAGIEWYSLQLDMRSKLPSQFNVIELAPEIRDLADTAAIIANLDLVITVDTSVAHVAGAIGAPVWMLNRFDSCWRWGPSDETTSWYPSMRIFRQPSFGNWSPVISDVRRALAAWARDPTV